MDWIFVGASKPSLLRLEQKLSCNLALQIDLPYWKALTNDFTFELEKVRNEVGKQWTQSISVSRFTKTESSSPVVARK